MSRLAGLTPSDKTDKIVSLLWNSAHQHILDLVACEPGIPVDKPVEAEGVGPEWR